MAQRNSFIRTMLITCALVPILAAAQPCPSTDALHSTSLGLSGQDGIFFNITASAPVTIECFQTYFTSNSLDRTNVYIWYRDGSHIGVETDPSQWILIDSLISFTISSNQSLLQYVPIAIDVDIPANGTAAFYITNGDLTGMTNTGIRYDHTTGNPGVLAATDGTISIQSGAGSYDRWVIFSGSRLFAGQVNYNTSTTGLAGELSTSRLGLFPNPVHDQLTIDLGSATGAVEVRILDGTGKLMHLERRLGSGPLPIDLTTLAPGIYVAQVLQNEGLRTRTFVKD